MVCAFLTLHWVFTRGLLRSQVIELHVVFLPPVDDELRWDAVVAPPRKPRPPREPQGAHVNLHGIVVAVPGDVVVGRASRCPVEPRSSAWALRAHAGRVIDSGKADRGWDRLAVSSVEGGRIAAKEWNAKDHHLPSPAREVGKAKLARLRPEVRHAEGPDPLRRGGELVVADRVDQPGVCQVIRIDHHHVVLWSEVELLSLERQHDVGQLRRDVRAVGVVVVTDLRHQRGAGVDDGGAGGLAVDTEAVAHLDAAHVDTPERDVPGVDGTRGEGQGR
eukprot:scaffold87654_cov69-Phaeocystis_antarctica.AAC.6